MGIFTSKKKETSFEGEEINFDHFQVLRAIGRGSFGKVCIVQKKDTRQMFAMKYMNKAQCEARYALHNVFREIEILASLNHPFLVNLWYSFQDAEDMFTVVELLLGGDLRYHLQQGVTFSDDSVRLFITEVGSALTYLHQRNIIHRDIKPDNLLLDEEGHVHLTDFNIATVVRSGQLATSMSGTKPYMAPEVFECAAEECPGYDSAVDWWSLGVAAYEVRRGKRPYDIHSSTSLTDIRALFLTPPRFPADTHPGLVQLISRLLTVNARERARSMEDVRAIPYAAALSLDDVINKKIQPPFQPPKDHLNCDPTFELEEMIIESRPLHKKKKRLSKQKSLTHTSHSGNTDAEGERYGGMLVFNREMEEARREKERREREREEMERRWQEELEESMRLSDPTGHGCSFSGSQCNTPVKKRSRGHKVKGGKSGQAPPSPPLALTSDDPIQLTRCAVTPANVRARIAGSPKVKVRGSTVTIESPRSSSSLTKTSTQQLKERLKELQADQRQTKTDSEASDVTRSDDVTLSGSQSQRSSDNLSPNLVAGDASAHQSEHEMEDSATNYLPELRTKRKNKETKAKEEEKEEKEEETEGKVGEKVEKGEERELLPPAPPPTSNNNNNNLNNHNNNKITKNKKKRSNAQERLR